jgi:uncharacterized protein YndB with AHSA1/START domain
MGVSMATNSKGSATVEVVSDSEVLITRSFNAPRRIVFDAITKPEHVKHWYGVRGLTVVVCQIDLRPGGTWRYVLRGPDGMEHGFSGVYREIVPPERIVSTENYEPIGPGHEMVATVTLEESNGRTTLRNRLRYLSQADRDGHLQSGMEGGMQEAFDRLEELLVSIA